MNVAALTHCPICRYKFSSRKVCISSKNIDHFFSVYEDHIGIDLHNQYFTDYYWKTKTLEISAAKISVFSIGYELDFDNFDVNQLAAKVKEKIKLYEFYS